MRPFRAASGRLFRLRSIPGADEFCIALIILPICIVCTVVATSFQPHKPVQIVHSPPPVVKVQARFPSVKKERT